MEYKKRKKKKKKKKDTRKTQKEILHQTPNFLLLSRLEPTPLASKLIERALGFEERIKKVEVVSQLERSTLLEEVSWR
jgi:hypothetical protein